MIDFSCPRCGTVYHADESHIGKQMRCTHRDCDEVVTIDRQDGHYKYSAQQVQRATTWKSEVAKPNKGSVRAPISRRLNRRFAASALAVALILAIGVGEYYVGVGVRRQHAKAQPHAVVELSPDEVEVASSDSTRSEQAPQPANPFYPQQLLPNAPPNVERRSKPRIAASQQAPARSLPTGTRIIPDEATTGDGELEAINGTSLDSCVRVVDQKTGKRVREIFVEATSSFLMEHLDAGDYRIVFATGKDWDSQAERFNRNARYLEFGKTLEFKQDATSYERHTITLNPVPNGNVQSRAISEAEFHALSGWK